LRVALLTAGRDRHYALGLGPALANAGVELDFVGNSEMESFPGLQHPGIRFFNLRGEQGADASLMQKVRRVLLYYWRLLKFSSRTDAAIFHILWPNKFVYFDRTILNLFYRALGKTLVFTAHNVNTEARDQKDSWPNRCSLRIQYALAHHVFVHTPEMKKQLLASYGVPPDKVTVVDFPINNVTPRTNLSREDARKRLGIAAAQKMLLFFGNIAHYKGLEDLIQALPTLSKRLGDFRLFVVGNAKAGEADCLDRVNQLISKLGLTDLVDQRIAYIPESEVELYFKAADVLVLPYRRIFQSGVLFLAYSFGVPVVASDAGSLRNDVLEGKTGFVCKANDPADLAEQICRYFDSPLFVEIEHHREWIKDYANRTHSWEPVATTSRRIYQALAGTQNRHIELDINATK
jgi:glycosyltransferase involved in cell wall biosynthesis